MAGAIKEIDMKVSFKIECDCGMEAKIILTGDSKGTITCNYCGRTLKMKIKEVKG
jgi:transcription elongation factor Elf1